MAVTHKDLYEQKEKMQEDLLCILDGLDNDILTNVCQVIVDRMSILAAKIDV
jgi:hypothetical protein